MTEARTTILNPKYIKEMFEEGPSAAETFAETFRNTYGWEVMKPEMLDDNLWEDMKKVYVDDRYKLSVREFFEKKNPYALQEMTAVMLETIRKGYWKADEATKTQIAELHVELIKKHKPGCSGFVCDNSKLQNMISGLIKKPDLKKQYNNAIEKIRSASGSAEKVKGMHLEKQSPLEKTPAEMIRENLFAVSAVSAIILLLFLSVIWGVRSSK
jgi:cobaltochelatase CobN